LQVSGWIAAAASIIVPTLPVQADDTSQGRSAYIENCVVCHGIDGKGAGPESVRLRMKPADLTSLARRNNGVFSPAAVYELIDGRKAVRVHRNSEMPIWGCRQPAPEKRAGKAHKADELGSLLDLSCDSESVIHGRIESIVDYLGTVQVK